MILVTLEGIDASYDDLIRAVHEELVGDPSKPDVHTLPISPIPTSAQHVSTCFEKILARLSHMRRVQEGESHAARNHLVLGSSWIQSPRCLDRRGRLMVHDMNLRLARALSEAFDVHVGVHIVVFLDTDIDEAYARTLDTMELSSMITFDDMLESQKFVHDVRDGHVAASVYPHVKLRFALPPFALDNAVDMTKTAQKIVDELRRVVSR